MKPPSPHLPTGILFVTLLLFTPLSHSEESAPVIVPYPDTPVWSDPVEAARAFDGFEFLGEFLREGEGLQVTPAGGRFYLSRYQGGLPGAGWDGSEVQHQWRTLDEMDAALKDWEKTDRSPAVTGKPAPAGALILFDGSHTEAWKNGSIEKGLLKAGTRTVEEFQDFTLYLEYLIPLKPEPPLGHPHRGNSGVFAVGAYEIQISDTFGLDPAPAAWEEEVLLKPVNTWCGSIYGIRAPELNLCLPPLVWQSMEIDFTAARFEGDRKVSPARISVIHNGVKVHDQIELPHGTGGGPSGPRPEVASGPISLQNHGNPNLFRNIWILPR